MSYTVDLYGSHPDDRNDDCHTGDDFPTLEEALEAFNNPEEYFPNDYQHAAYILLDGPDIHKIRKNPDFQPIPDNDAQWRREMAMEAGMLHGVEAYNDFMGWSLD